MDPRSYKLYTCWNLGYTLKTLVSKSSKFLKCHYNISYVHLVRYDHKKVFPSRERITKINQI